MECCLVLVVLPPQLEDNVALRARPFGVLVLDPFGSVEASNFDVD